MFHSYSCIGISYSSFYYPFGCYHVDEIQTMNTMTVYTFYLSSNSINLNYHKTPTLYHLLYTMSSSSNLSYTPHHNLYQYQNDHHNKINSNSIHLISHINMHNPLSMNYLLPTIQNCYYPIHIFYQSY